VTGRREPSEPFGRSQFRRP